MQKCSTHRQAVFWRTAHWRTTTRTVSSARCFRRTRYAPEHKFYSNQCVCTYVCNKTTNRPIMTLRSFCIAVICRRTGRHTSSKLSLLTNTWRENAYGVVHPAPHVHGDWASALYSHAKRSLRSAGSPIVLRQSCTAVVKLTELYQSRP